MPIKKIKFERTGGFAGIRIAAEIKMDDLSDDQKHEIINLIDEADFYELSEKLSSRMPIPDGFVYSITVNTDEKEHTILAGEASLPDNVQPLIEILGSIAKKQMRNKG